MAELSHIDLNGESLEIADEAARKSIDTLQETQEQAEQDLGIVRESMATLQEAQEQNTAKLTEHTENQYNPHGVTKDQVGLSDVDNTSDTNKPVSTAQQAAIDAAYANSNYYTDEKIAALINGAPTTLDTLKEIADAMAEHADVVAALEEAIGKKANESEFNSHVTNINNPHGVTKEHVGLGNVPNVATNDQTPTYTADTETTALVSGEKLSIAFGKIAVAVSKLISHLSDKNNPHGVSVSDVGALTPEDVIDNLLSTATNQPLSANQGRVLNERANTHYNTETDYLEVMNADGEWVQTTYKMSLLRQVLFEANNNAANFIKYSGTTSSGGDSSFLTITEGETLNIKLSSSTGHIGASAISDIIDVSSYNKLVMHFTGSNSNTSAANASLNCAKIFLTQTKAATMTAISSTTLFSATASIEDTIEIDLTNISGAVYVGIELSVNAATTIVDVIEMYLE